jgi:hypothetical protein
MSAFTDKYSDAGRAKAYAGFGSNQASNVKKMTSPEYMASHPQGDFSSDFRRLNTLGNDGVLFPQQVQASPWLQMTKDSQATDYQNMFNNEAQNQQSALKQSQNNMAMRGGLSAGAMARMGGQSEDNLALSRQNILSQGASGAADLNMQGANMEADRQKFNAGLMQGANQFNVGNTIADQDAANAQNRFMYGQGMALKGAAMSGQAMENAGNKGTRPMWEKWF